MIKIISNQSGEVLYERQGDTLVKADLRGIDLRYANLHGQNLSGANLQGVNLYDASMFGCNLTNADLSAANLRNVNMQDACLHSTVLCNADMAFVSAINASFMGATMANANVRGANFSAADFRCADLAGVDISTVNLSNAVGEANKIYSLQLYKYRVVIAGSRMWIGCQVRPIKEWWTITEGELIDIGGYEAVSQWVTWKPLLQMIISELSLDEGIPGLPVADRVVPDRYRASFQAAADQYFNRNLDRIVPNMSRSIDNVIGPPTLSGELPVRGVSKLFGASVTLPRLVDPDMNPGSENEASNGGL